MTVLDSLEMISLPINLISYLLWSQNYRKSIEANNIHRLSFKYFILFYSLDLFYSIYLLKFGN